MVASAVSWEELEGSPRETFTRDGSVRMVRTFKTAWTDRHTFIGELYFGNNNVAQTYPNFTDVFVDTVDVEPLVTNPSGGAFTDPSSSLTAHDEAKITATYTPLVLPEHLDSGSSPPPTTQPDVQTLPDGTWATYKMSFSGEFFTLPNRSFVWSSDSTVVPPDITPTLVIPITDHIVTWHSVTYPPWKAISDLRGKVNQTEFKIPATDMRVYSETLLFMGADADREFKQNGTQGWRLTYTFKERAIWGLRNTQTAGAIGLGADKAQGSIGWNHAYKPVRVPFWDYPVDLEDSSKMYRLGEFDDLFEYQLPD